MKQHRNLHGIWQKSMQGLKRASPTILTCISAVGVVGTAVLAIRATAKATKLLEEATDEKGEELTKLEVVKVAGPTYIPTVVIGASTITCIVGSNLLNQRQQASLASAYAMLNQSYGRYRKAAKEVYGKDADAKINAKVAEDVYISGQNIVNSGIIYSPEWNSKSDQILFYDMVGQGGYFWSTIPAVLNAMYHVNRNLACIGAVTVNDYRKFIGIEETIDGDEQGWDMDLVSEEGCLWLDFENCFTKLDDGMECCVISTNISPIFFNSVDVPF
jgi:hypothetical protein